MPSIVNCPSSGDFCLNTSGVSRDNTPFHTALHQEGRNSGPNGSAASEGVLRQPVNVSHVGVQSAVGQRRECLWRETALLLQIKKVESKQHHDILDWGEERL